MNNQDDRQQVQQNPLPPPYPYYAPTQEDEINLFELWKILVAHKKIIFTITTISTLLAIVYAVLATPVYRAETLLAPVTQESGGRFSALTSQFGGLASLAGINFGGKSGSSQEAIATLRSREFTAKFITQENLMPVLFESAWDSENNKWLDDHNPRTLWDAYELFSNVRSISVNKETGFVVLAIEWKDPYLAKTWANKLIVSLNNELRREAIIHADKSIQYLKNELEKTSVVEIKKSLYSLIESETKSKMLANTKEEFAFRFIDKAVVPEDRIRPKRKKIVILGFILGLSFGVFIVFIRYILRGR